MRKDGIMTSSASQKYWEGQTKKEKESGRISKEKIKRQEDIYREIGELVINIGELLLEEKNL